MEMRDFRKLNQQVNEVKRILNSFIQKLIPPEAGLKTNRTGLTLRIFLSEAGYRNITNI